jgi:hypothetical protein
MPELFMEATEAALVDQEPVPDEPLVVRENAPAPRQATAGPLMEPACGNGLTVTPVTCDVVPQVLDTE